MIEVASNMAPQATVVKRRSRCVVIVVVLALLLVFQPSTQEGKTRYNPRHEM